MSLRILIIRVTLVIVFFEILIPPWQYSPDVNLPDNISITYRLFLTPPTGSTVEIDRSLLGFQVFITLLLGGMIAYSVSPRPIPQISSLKEGHHGPRKVRRRSHGRGQNWHWIFLKNLLFKQTYYWVISWISFWFIERNTMHVWDSVRKI